jgi:hypothetical protein
MSTADLLQAKVATLPEPIAAEVLDFLEFVTAKRHIESKRLPENIDGLRGSLKGRLASSAEFAARKSDEIRLEE